MDVSGWLRTLGLDQYEDKFRDNRIDAEVLPHLTADDLREIGVAAVGDRRKLLAAIAALAPRPRPEDAPAPVARPAPLRALEAERRPITVLFCDLVGSTTLAAKLDAEDWRNLVNAYLDEASKAVTSLGGHVLKKLGDGLMALFGYPQAEENDAERAVRAALAIHLAIADINARNAEAGAPELSARIGLESGPVIVESEGEVFGDAPNVAARVQAAAEPGSVLVTSTVQRQVAGLFIAEDTGAHQLKGLPAPMTLYRITRKSGGRRRTGARLLTPFVGREDDLAALARRWDWAIAGEGQFVLISGEPGIGKSRLVEEFRARLGETPHTWVEWSCSQLLQNTPLHPIAEWGRVRFGGPEVPAERRLEELESILAQVKLDPAEYAPLLAPMADIPVPPERLPNLPPDEFRRKQLAAMVAWVRAGARAQPLVLFFDDLHWADPSSIDLVQALSEGGARARLLILATARPEFRPPWSLRSYHSIISLAPLEAAQVHRMVAEVAARHALSADVVKGLSERTGGVPLFVEEVTRLLLERGEQGGVQAIPPNLRQSLAARLDRLGAAREVAQIGAVLGRSFSYSLLREVAVPPAVSGAGLREGGLNEASLRSALDRLLEADLLFVESGPREPTYRFKHALIQDAAYDSLLKSRRQALHRRAAEALVAAGGESRSGRFADETRMAYARVGELATQAGDSLERNVVHQARWIASFIRGDLKVACENVDLFLQEAEASGRLMDVAAAHRSVGLTRLFQGEFALARFHLERALAGHVPERDIDARRFFGSDTGVTAMAFLSLLVWLMGEADAARRLIEQAIRQGNETEHAATIATNHLFLTRLEVSRDDPVAALPAAQALLAYARAHDIALYALYGEIFSSWAFGRLKDPEAGLNALHQAVSGYIALENKNAAPTFYSLIADLEARGGHADRALASIEQALAIAQETGEGWTNSVLFRRKGEILVNRDPRNPGPAEEAFRTAAAVAEQQGARTLTLQAALALAKLRQSNSRSGEARAVLEPALKGLSPTPELPEIAEAQLLLARLG